MFYLEGVHDLGVAESVRQRYHTAQHRAVVTRARLVPLAVRGDAVGDLPAEFVQRVLAPPRGIWLVRKRQRDQQQCAVPIGRPV